VQRYTLFFIPPNVFEKKFQKYTKNNAELRKIKHRKGEKHTKSRGDREEGGKKEGKKGEKGDPRANTRGTGAKTRAAKRGGTPYPIRTLFIKRVHARKVLGTSM